MYPVSAAFTAALSQPHQTVSRVDVLTADVVQRTLDVIEGNVQVAKEATGRRRCNITLTDLTGVLTPATALDLLTPFGNELRLYRGIQLSTGPEYIPLGVFGISESVIEDGGGNFTIAIQAYDRARKVARQKFTDDYVIASGTNYATAIRTVISSRMPATQQYNFINTVRATPLLRFNTGDDPWEKATAMAQSIGAVLYFDPSGICVLTPEPDSATRNEVYTYAEGVTATLLSVNKKNDDERTYNHIIVAGEVPGFAPVRAEAKDIVTTSPTYVGDPLFTINLALNKPVTAGAATTDGPLSVVTDGLVVHGSNLTTYTTQDTAGGTIARYVQIDMGVIQVIDTIRVMNYADNRIWYGSRDEVSIDGVNWTLVSNIGTYQSAVGQYSVRTFPPVSARFVRNYTSGNASSPSSAHWVEVQVHRATTVYGDVVLFFPSQYVTSQAQAQEAANGALRRAGGYAEQVRINVIPNPALEADDVIQVTRARSKTNNKYVIDSFNVPLNASGVMNINTRQRTT